MEVCWIHIQYGLLYWSVVRYTARGSHRDARRETVLPKPSYFPLGQQEIELRE